MIETQVQPSRPAFAAKLAAAMFLISFATVLFTLSIWKLLSFFIMPALFFDLLFVGFPVGAFLGVRFFDVSLSSFRRTLWILQAVMLASILACLTCKHFDYLRANLFEVKILKLMGQMGTFTLLFIPFFCAYGLSEYVGYQLGRREMKGKMQMVYAVYLFGAAFAYLFKELALERTGITALLGISVLLVGLSSFFLAGGARGRVFFGLESLALLTALCAPGLESRFLVFYKGTGGASTRDYAVSFGYESRFQTWGRYSFTEIMYSPTERQYAGFYNDILQWEYSPRVGFKERMLGAVPINEAPAGGRIAIIGAGGGRQVKWALQSCFSFEKILALEIEPAVFDAVRGDLLEDFERVYEHPTVQPVVAEARGYMERTAESFDLIFMPSVGGYPQMMLEPGNMIRTADAYRTLRERLTPRGILAIWYPAGLDPQSILTQQYVSTLSQALGMKTQAYYNRKGKYVHEYLILAAKDPLASLPRVEDVEKSLTATGDPGGLPPLTGPDSRVYPFFVNLDPRFKPITDNQPFLAGNVRHIFSLEQVYLLFVAATGVLGALGVALLSLLRRAGDPQIPGRTYWQVAGLSLLIGGNFIVFEHYVVLALFKKLYLFQDALTLGAIGFLVTSGLGSILVTPRTRGAFQVLATALLVPLLLFQETLPMAGTVALLIPVAFVTGSFFPALFELAWRNPLCVFAMDAVGAAAGSALAFFIPIAFGFSWFFPVGCVVFALTAFFTWRFCRIARV